MQVMPVILDALPLKEDFEEAQPVYACLSALLADSGTRGRLQSCLPRLLAALEEVQGQSEVPQEVSVLVCCKILCVPVLNHPEQEVCGPRAMEWQRGAGTDPGIQEV